MAPSTPRQQQAVLAHALFHGGLDVRDFELDRVAAPLTGAADAVIVVRRRSTGSERMYFGGPCSGWLAAVLGDVRGGAFA